MHSSRRGPGPRIALVSGFWGQNIGNAFFNIGGRKILQTAFPDRRIEFIQDQPGYRTFNNQRKGNPKKDIGLLRYLDIDYIVLQGPMLTVNFRYLWEDVLRDLTSRNTRIILLSAALFRYTEEEIRINREFLSDYPPAIVVTRDSVTYEAIRDCSDRVYDGIDSAFFVPDVYQPFDLHLEPYITVNFDRYPEPNIYVDTDESRRPSNVDLQFQALGQRWGVRSPRFQHALSRSGKWQAYVGALLDFRRLPKYVGGYLIVRPEHRSNPHVTWKIYKQPNALASDEPFTYFTIYSGSQLTLSDRVHACVVTLAFGKPAMLFSPTPRSALFSRLGLDGITRTPVTLDSEALEREKQAELEFMRSAVQYVEGKR